MQRYKHTWFNGMLKDPKGKWVKDKDATEVIEFNYRKINCQIQEYKTLHSKFSDERIISLFLKYFLVLSIFCNIGQLIYHLN